MTQSRSQASRQDGFTLIETMIAIAIMSIGIVALLAAFGTAVATTQNAQANLIARQKALQAMESIYTVRNTQQITFSQIGNIASGGIFTNGATQLLSASPPCCCQRPRRDWEPRRRFPPPPPLDRAPPAPNAWSCLALTASWAMRM